MKIDFRSRNIFETKSDPSIIIIKWFIYLKYIIILNVYVANSKTSKYLKQKLIQIRKIV